MCPAGKKTHGGWAYTPLEPGTFLWTSRHGYQYLRDRSGTHDVTHDITRDRRGFETGCCATSSTTEPSRPIAPPPHTPPTGGATGMPGRPRPTRAPQTGSVVSDAAIVSRSSREAEPYFALINR